MVVGAKISPQLLRTQNNKLFLKYAERLDRQQDWGINGYSCLFWTTVSDKYVKLLAFRQNNEKASI